MARLVDGYVGELKDVLDELPHPELEDIGELLFQAYEHRKQVFVVGNGGSAASASHMACDLGKNTIGGRQQRLRIQSLTDNTPLMTALGNDLGYDNVFSEQLVNLIRPGDLLICLTGSGNSENVLNAMRYARESAATVVAIVGFDGGRAIGLADRYVRVNSRDYGVIEDSHMIISHVLTSYLRDRISGVIPAPS